MDSELQELKVPSYSIALLLSAVAPFERDGMRVHAKRTGSYVSISAEDRNVALYVHKTRVSVALDPDTAIWADGLYNFCKIQDRRNQSTRYIRMTHGAIRDNRSIALHLFICAMQRSSGHSGPRDRLVLERRQASAASLLVCPNHGLALADGLCEACETASENPDDGGRIDTVDDFIQSLRNGEPRSTGPVPADLDADWSMREAQVVAMLNKIDSTISIQTSAASGGSCYIQARNEFDGLLVEAVSNEFLSPRRFLHPEVVAKLIEWGWSPPDSEDSPNFTKFYPEPWPIADVAREFVLVFRDVYGVMPNDAWGVSPESLALTLYADGFTPAAPEFDDPGAEIEGVDLTEIWEVDPLSGTFRPFDPEPVPDPALVLGDNLNQSADADARLIEVLHALGTDLMYAMSRSAQELFHTNTWAWLTESIPGAADALLRLLGSTTGPGEKIGVWREYRHLDLLINPGGTHPKVVIENKLFSVPGTEQLLRYARTPLPWSSDHGEHGAINTQYVLLSLLPPSFALPKPWSHIGYDKLAVVMDALAGAPDEARPLVAHYAQLLRRLSTLATAIDPRFRRDESFYDWQPEGAGLSDGPFQGIVQKLRFSGLVQLVQEQLNGPPLDFEVSITHGTGLTGYRREITASRMVGWQLQGNQFRLYVRMKDDGLYGRGSAIKEARSHAAAEEHADWFDFAIAERFLGPLLRPRRLGARTFLHFDPDFVYQTRTLDRSIKTSQLADLLAQYTLEALSYVWA